MPANQKQSLPANQPPIKAILGKKSVEARFEELLGRKASGFISSLLQLTLNDRLLVNAEPQTVLNAAATAAALDLPINPNLGHAWIVGYKDNRKRIVVAQFQIGWKGYVQLAQRSGQYARINAVPVFENQFKGFNAMTEELNADFTLPGEGKIVGYAAYFRLINGFEKTAYWSKDQVQQHAERYSQAFRSNVGPWADESQFDAMALKTVLKNTLNKWGPLSIEMQTALLADQSVQSSPGEYYYSDNQQGIDIAATDHEKERARVLKHIEKASTPAQLERVKDLVELYDLADEYDNRLLTLQNADNEPK